MKFLIVLVLLCTTRVTAQRFNSIAPLKSIPLRVGIRAVIVQPPAQGQDVGASVNSAIASLGGSCGIVTIPSGYYSITTTIMKPRCVLIDGQNSVISGQGSNGSMIVTGDVMPGGYPYVPGDYARGGIMHLTLAGPGTSGSAVGIWMGGGFSSSGSNYWDFLETFTDVLVENFHYGVVVGTEAHQNEFMGGALVANFDGLYWNQPGQAVENLSMFGTQILNNVLFGIDAYGGGYGELNLYGCSLDYNGTGSPKDGGQPAQPPLGGGIHWDAGTLNVYGGHFEQATGYMIVSNSNTASSSISIGGGTVMATPYAGSSVTDDAYFYLISPNVHFTLENGVVFQTAHAYNGIVYFNGAGADNRFTIGTYSFSNQASQSAFINTFTAVSSTPNVVISPIAVQTSGASGTQIGMSFPNLRVTSQAASGGTRYACFDTSGNLISSTTPCSGY